MRSLIRAGALATVCLVVAMPGFAADKAVEKTADKAVAQPVVKTADKAKVEKLMVLMKTDVAIGQLKDVVIRNVEMGYSDGTLASGATNEQVAQGRPVVDGMVDTITKSLGWEALKAELIDINSKELTDAEVDAGIKFYETPEGKALAEKQLKLAQRSTDVAQARLQLIWAPLQNEMKKALEKAKEKPVAKAAAADANKAAADSKAEEGKSDSADEKASGK